MTIVARIEQTNGERESDTARGTHAKYSAKYGIYEINKAFPFLLRTYMIILFGQDDV